ncbi:helix-turn-helix domain-containing protein [Anaerocellum danielii]|uniref:Helix-turn-helix domain-containing protein n=1 Tax=Anaerocellum danielii TaxID=1387557 RepID=A0ABZ0TYK6_9FIRM|nr:helix-turn-helix domain-containing protein [Caldicellulosiruptor danielii]WPX08146.1 helix-turn-helix domain-containing protein [Caldicellulosiruptor danielii]
MLLSVQKVGKIYGISRRTLIRGAKRRGNSSS